MAVNSNTIVSNFRITKFFVLTINDTKNIMRAINKILFDNEERTQKKMIKRSAKIKTAESLMAVERERESYSLFNM